MNNLWMEAIASSRVGSTRDVFEQLVREHERKVIATWLRDQKLVYFGSIYSLADKIEQGAASSGEDCKPAHDNRVVEALDLVLDMADSSRAYIDPDDCTPNMRAEALEMRDAMTSVRKLMEMLK